MRAPWGVEFVDEEPLSIHAVFGGELWIEYGDAPAERLLQGDIALIRDDDPYRFVHRPGAPAQPLAALMESALVPGTSRTFAFGGEHGGVTKLLCGAYVFEGSVCDTLLQALPPVAVLRGGQADPSTRTALGLLADEVGRDAPGQQSVLDRLLDLLLVYCLRTWFAQPEAAPPAWYTALADDAVRPALQALHAEPARGWTVATLAAEAGLSRAAFARRFTAAVGTAPLAYLTTWRMQLAAESLRRSDRTLAQVADEVGYANEFAFSAAFKRFHGSAPGTWRRRPQLAA